MCHYMYGHLLVIGHWLDMVYLPLPMGNFVDHIFLIAQCLARILQHVSTLAMAALGMLQFSYMINESNIVCFILSFLNKNVLTCLL